MPKRCALGCSNKNSYHQFPHPEKNPDRFKAWVHIAGGKLDSPADYELYKKKVICDNHFTHGDRNRNNRLNFIAVPSLHIPGKSDEAGTSENVFAPEPMNAESSLATLEPTLTVTSDMDPWNCCRTCLGVESLHPIFQFVEHHEKYSDVIFSATGLKVDCNDTLPQKMCTSCINYINFSYKFRKKCEENQKLFLDRLNNKPIYDVKIESNIFNIENNSNIAIDISDLINDFDHHEDSINSFNYDSIENNDNEEIKFETKVQDLVDKPVELIFKTKKSKKSNEKPVKRTLRRKKESGENKLTVKEEIECEYCHKILTSKLSLRNHYKIHTGFDVVCEHCGKKFITRRLLLMHCRAKHGYEKTDKCSFCDYKASNAEQVKIHERLHTGEKPFVCSECGTGFHRKSSYLQHVAIHLPDKNVQCDQCPARFKSVTLMRIHKNRHKTPQYSFKCRVCENTFVRRRNVVRHLMRIHAVQAAPHHIDRMKIA